jgi:hypothetical protein
VSHSCRILPFSQRFLAASWWQPSYLQRSHPLPRWIQCWGIFHLFILIDLHYLTACSDEVYFFIGREPVLHSLLHAHSFSSSYQWGPFSVHYGWSVSTDQLVAAGAYWNPLPLLAGSLSSPLTQLWAHQECASFWLQSPLLHMCIFSHPLILGGARQLDSPPFIHTQAEVPGLSQGSLGCTTFFRIATGRPCAAYNRPCPLSWWPP